MAYEWRRSWKVIRESLAAAARRSNRCLIVSDVVGAVLEGEHVVAGGVIVGAEELALAVLMLAPSAQCRDGGPIDRYRLVGILGFFATRFVPRVASDDDPVVVHGDLAGVEVDG